MSKEKKSTIELGKKVPAFKVDSSSGEKFEINKMSGKNVVLFFYPKDNTPGCTLEGQEFNKLLAQFTKQNTKIYGISRDSLKSHDKFIDSCGFKFELLSDEDENLCSVFDVIKEKNMYGKKVMGIERSTFLIDSEGVLRHEWRKVKPEGHAQEVLQFIKTME